MLDFGVSVAVLGVIDTPAVTVTITLDVLLSESVAATTSVTFGVAPAGYAPELASMVPPDALVFSDHVMPLALPPLAMNASEPFGGVVGMAGLIARPPPTDTLTLATLPSESETETVSTVTAVGPALYAPV